VLQARSGASFTVVMASATILRLVLTHGCAEKMMVADLVRGETSFYGGVVRGGCFVMQVPSSSSTAAEMVVRRGGAEGWCLSRCCTFQAHRGGKRASLARFGPARM